MCDECKKTLKGKIAKFLEDHQKKREAARKKLKEFIVTHEDLASEKFSK